jgi:hypothetical protein
MYAMLKCRQKEGLSAEEENLHSRTLMDVVLKYCQKERFAPPALSTLS